jgi:hypothetical protein
MLADMIDRGIHCSEEWPSAQRGKLAFNGQPFRYPTPVERIRPRSARWLYDHVMSRRGGLAVVAGVKGVLRGNRGPRPLRLSRATAPTR